MPRAGRRSPLEASLTAPVWLLRPFFLFLCVLLVLGSFPIVAFADDQNLGSSRTSVTEDVTQVNVSRVAELAAQLKNGNANPDRTSGGFSWDKENEERSWTYYNGIMMDAFLMLDEDGFTEYANRFYSANITSQGEINKSGARENYYRQNELDSIVPARALFDLLRNPMTSNSSPQNADKYRQMIYYIYKIMQGYARVRKTVDIFKHKTNDANWETYLMAAAYAMEAAEIHSSPTATLNGGEDMFLSVNEVPDFSGVSVLLEYANGTSRTVTSENLTFGECDPTVPGRKNVDVYYKDIYCGTIAVTFEEPVTPAPSFASCSLVLSGQIGVNVFVDLPGDVSEYADSYMAFFVNGIETDVPLNTTFMNSKKVAYGFTCYVNVLQMAEEITAVFHYGADNAQTIETEVSVVDYLSSIKGDLDLYGSEMVDLARAMGDYG